MKKNWLIIGSTLLFFVLLFSLNLGITDEKSSKVKGYLGVVIEPLDNDLKDELKANYGVLIAKVEIESPADECGLSEDDVIQKVDNVKIRRPHTLTRVIRKIAPGTEVKIQIKRDGREKTLSVVIGKLKKSHNFIISTDPKKDMLLSFFRKGGGYLGVHLKELDEDLAPYFGVKPDEGVLILEVEEDSPAEKAGLKTGDVIKKIDGESVSNPEDAQEIISDYEEDDKIELIIVRKKRETTINAVLEEREGFKNIFYGPNNIKKSIYISPGKKLLELHNLDKNIYIDEDIHIKKSKPHIKIEKKKKVKFIVGLI